MTLTAEDLKNEHLESERLFREMSEPDPSKRILAIRQLGETALQWPAELRSQAVIQLRRLLSDGSTDEYMYGGFMCDEEQRMVRVCDEAARALAQIACSPARQFPTMVVRARVVHKAPEEIIVLVEMPLNTTGKVDRVTLKKMAVDAAAAPEGAARP